MYRHAIFLLATFICLAFTNLVLPDYTEFIESIGGPSRLTSILASHTGKADQIFYSERYVFHISRGSPYPGGLIAKSLWKVYTTARHHIDDQKRVPSKFEARHNLLPAFHLETNSGHFKYADLIDLCQAIRILTKEMNGGSLPTYGGVGFKWYGSFSRNGSSFMADGRFYFD